MPYAQKNYNELQGINGKYRIAQIGCFITAFCNIAERFGIPVNPLQMNSILRDRGIYIDVDDGIRDDVGWGTLSSVYPQIVVTGVGVGAPPSANAIAKFVYRSYTTGNMTTHFSMVDRVEGGTVFIYDSWDGVVKNAAVYGGVKAYATYAINNPQPVTPVKPVANPNELVVQSGWGLSHIAQAAGYGDATEPARWVAIAALNGSDNWQAFNASLKAGQIVRVRPEPTPEPPKPIETPPTPIVITTEPEPPVQPTAETPPTEAVITPTETPVEEIQPEQPHDWHTMVTLHIQDYKAIDTIVVSDLDGKEIGLVLNKDQIVHGGGTFVKDGVTYVRTSKSMGRNIWYGIPLDKLEIIPDMTDDELFASLDMGDELKELASSLSGRERWVARLATVQGYMLRFIGSIKILKNKKEKSQ